MSCRKSRNAAHSGDCDAKAKCNLKRRRVKLQEKYSWVSSKECTEAQFHFKELQVEGWKVTAAASVKIHDLLSGKYLEAQWFAMLLQHLLRPHPDAPSKMLPLLLQTAKYSIFQREYSLTSPTRVRMYFYCATRDSWLPLPEVDSQLQKFGNWHLLSSFLHKLSKKFVVLKKIVIRLFRFSKLFLFSTAKAFPEWNHFLLSKLCKSWTNLIFRSTF